MEEIYKEYQDKQLYYDTLEYMYNHDDKVRAEKWFYFSREHHHALRYHRIDKPAFIEYVNEKLRIEKYYTHNMLHRTDGPAVINYNIDGSIYKEFWLRDNSWHREDGPAFIVYENNKIIFQEYYLKDELYNEDKFYAKMNNLEVFE